MRVPAPNVHMHFVLYFPCSLLRVTYVGSALCQLGDQAHNTIHLQAQAYSHGPPPLLPYPPSFLLLGFPFQGGVVFCLPHQVVGRRRRLSPRYFRAHQTVLHVTQSGARLLLRSVFNFDFWRNF